MEQEGVCWQGQKAGSGRAPRMELTQQPHPHPPRSPAQTEPEDGAWRVTAQVRKWLWNSIKVEKAGGSLVRGVVRSVSQRQKPVATLTHSSAPPPGAGRLGSVLIWLIGSVHSTGKHTRQAPPVALSPQHQGSALGMPPPRRQSRFDLNQQAPAASNFTTAN